MYKMIKAIGYDGVDKINKIASKHLLEGDFIYRPVPCGVILFKYNDDSGQMMRSSIIKSVEFVNNQIRITTLNTEYWFEKVEG